MLFKNRVTNKDLLDAISSKNKRLSDRIDVLEDLLLRKNKHEGARGILIEMIENQTPVHFQESNTMETIVEAIYSESIVNGNQSITLIGSEGGRSTEHITYDNYLAFSRINLPNGGSL